jgi:hypothetical protein
MRAAARSHLSEDEFNEDEEEFDDDR